MRLFSKVYGGIYAECQGVGIVAHGIRGTGRGAGRIGTRRRAGARADARWRQLVA